MKPFNTPARRSKLIQWFHDNKPDDTHEPVMWAGSINGHKVSIVWRYNLPGYEGAARVKTALRRFTTTYTPICGTIFDVLEELERAVDRVRVEART